MKPRSGGERKKKRQFDPNQAHPEGGLGLLKMDLMYIFASEM